MPTTVVLSREEIATIREVATTWVSGLDTEADYLPGLDNLRMGGLVERVVVPHTGTRWAVTTAGYVAWQTATTRRNR